MIKYPHTKNKEILIIRIIYPRTTLKIFIVPALFLFIKLSMVDAYLLTSFVQNWPWLLHDDWCWIQTTDDSQVGSLKPTCLMYYSWTLGFPHKTVFQIGLSCLEFNGFIHLKLSMFVLFALSMVALPNWSWLLYMFYDKVLHKLTMILSNLPLYMWLPLITVSICYELH